MLERIKTPSDVSSLTSEEKKTLCEEIRKFLIENISHTGGHLASNLGTVELTVALLSEYNVPEDKIIWDVGHQSYTYKILTGRKDRMSTMRRLNGISGFPAPWESEYDAFVGGHSSTSVSAALGILKAERLCGYEGDVVAVIGDGALGGGEAFEGLNNVAASGEKLTVILNDNGMSISRNVGRLASHLTKVRNRPIYFTFKSKLSGFLHHIPFIGKPMLKLLAKIKFGLKNAFYHNGTVFENLGFTYLGPVDGHDIDSMINVIRMSKKIKSSCLIHVKTVKGKGYKMAEDNPSEYHGVSSFDPEHGIAFTTGGSFTSAFADALVTKAKNDCTVVAITAAMESGTGLSRFSRLFSDRFFDVGISEEHAVTFSAGLARGGLKPVFCVYSTFLSRCIDQIIHDCAICKENITLAIDRAGIVPEDGVTHQGIFDVAMLGTVPGIKVWSAGDYDDVENMFDKAMTTDGVTAVRYPKGKEKCRFDDLGFEESGEHKILKRNGKIALIGYGIECSELFKAAEIVEKRNIVCDVIKLGRIIPLEDDYGLDRYEKVFFFEDTAESGGIGERFAAKFGSVTDCRYFGIRDFLPHGTVDELLCLSGLDAASIAERVAEAL